MALNPRVKHMVQLSSKSNSSLFYLKKKKNAKYVLKDIIFHNQSLTSDHFEEIMAFGKL